MCRGLTPFALSKKILRTTVAAGSSTTGRHFSSCYHGDWVTFRSCWQTPFYREIMSMSCIIPCGNFQEYHFVNSTVTVRVRFWFCCRDAFRAFYANVGSWGACGGSFLMDLFHFHPCQNIYICAFSSHRTFEKFPKTAKIHRQNRELSANLLCVFTKIINIIFHVRNEFKPTVNAPKDKFYRQLTAWTVAQNCGLWYNNMYEFMQFLRKGWNALLLLAETDRLWKKT